MSAMKTRRILQKQTLLVLAALVWAFTGCQQKEDPQPESSTISTDGLGTITSTTAILNGTLNKIGSGGVTDYGFVWGETENPEVNSTNKKTFGATNEVTTFNHTITALTPGKTYHVRAYVTDAQGTFYGTNLTFNTLSPSISSFSPDNGAQTDTLTIGGSNFTEVTSDISVKIGSTNVTTIVSSTINEIKVVIPGGITEGANKITVSISGVETTSTSDFTYLKGLWTSKKAFPGGHVSNTSSFQLGSSIYVALGAIIVNSGKQLWQYDSATDTWTQKTDFGGTARFGSVIFTIGSKAYVGMGRDAGGAVKDFWEYDSSTNAWTQLKDFSGTVREGAIGFALNNKGYMVGGASTFGKEVWEYDPSGDSWVQKNNFPEDVASGRVMNIDGTIILGNNQSAKFWKYNATNDSWASITDFPGTVVSSNNDKFLETFVVGSKGYVIENFTQFRVWEYDPSADTWLAKAYNPRYKNTRPHYENVTGLGDKGYMTTRVSTDAIFWEFDPNK